LQAACNASLIRPSFVYVTEFRRIFEQWKSFPVTYPCGPAARFILARTGEIEE
jgi:hypothetical protein